MEYERLTKYGTKTTIAQ